MRITRLFGFSLAASLSVSAGAMAQHTGTHSAGAPTTGTAAAPAQTGQPVPSSAYADTALLTGLLGTRAPTGIATVEGRNVRVTLSGDQPGSTRAWYVHRGSCTRDEGIIGSARAYAPITIDARGSGSGSVSLDAPFAVGGTYFVAVHASATDARSETIVCGPLAKSAMASTAPGARSMANMGNMPMSHSGNIPVSSRGNMAGMDHSAMGRTGMSMPAMAGSPSSDSTVALVLTIHARMMADPVIRERAMTDPVLRDMLARVPSGEGTTMGTGAMPGMATPAPSQAARRAAAPAASRSTSRSTSRPPSRSSASNRGATAKSTQAKKPAATPARKPAPKPTATPAPKKPMPSMPGMDHSNMPGMGKP